MRKKSQKHLFDNIMWYLIYLLPLIAILIALRETTTLDEALTFIGANFAVIESTDIYDSLNSLFGVGGALEVFTGNLKYVMYYFTYFIYCMIAHLVVDVLVFIPRLAHHWMSDIGGED